MRVTCQGSCGKSLAAHSCGSVVINNGGGHGRGDGRGDGEKTATVSRGAPQSGGSCEGTPTATTTTMACEYMYMYLPSDGCTDCATVAEDCSAGENDEGGRGRGDGRGDGDKTVAMQLLVAPVAGGSGSASHGGRRCQPAAASGMRWHRAETRRRTGALSGTVTPGAEAWIEAGTEAGIGTGEQGEATAGQLGLSALTTPAARSSSGARPRVRGLS